MQVQNASTGSGASTPLSANVTWWYPNLPGEPPNVLHRELAVCIPSNVTISSVCCAAANGRFVTQELGNSENLDDSEVRAIYEERYPGQNLSGAVCLIAHSRMSLSKESPILPAERTSVTSHRVSKTGSLVSRTTPQMKLEG
jgi:hypothetical protein